MENEIDIMDQFNEVADRVEKELHNEVQVIIDQNWDGTWHVEVQERTEEEDEEDWACHCVDGWFTINEKRDCKSPDEAAQWLENQYL